MKEDNILLADISYKGSIGALNYKGIRYLIVRPETVVEIQKSLTEELGGARAGEVFYRSGYRGTSLTAKRLLDEGASRKDIMRSMFHMGANLGWGKFSVLNIDEASNRFTVRVEGSPFAEAYGKHNEPVCFLLSGALAGILSGAYDRKYRCGEVECAAKGDPYCVFFLEPEIR